MSLNSQLSPACHRSTRLLPYLKPSRGTNCIEKRTHSSPQPSCHLFLKTHLGLLGSLLHTFRPYELPPPSIPQWAPSGLRALVPEAAQPQISPTASSSSPAAHWVSPTASKRPFLPTPLKGGFPALPFHRITGQAVLIYSLASPTAAQARQGRDLV